MSLAPLIVAIVAVVAVVPLTVTPVAVAAPTAGLDLPKVNARTGLPDGWNPGPERYGVGETKNHEIVMADGVVLRADVRFPTEANGAPAPGPFPIVMTQTAYGKDSQGLLRVLSYDWLGPELNKILPSGVDVLKQVADAAGYGDYFVRRGYIQVSVDLRGTDLTGRIR